MSDEEDSVLAKDGVMLGLSDAVLDRTRAVARRIEWRVCQVMRRHSLQPANGRETQGAGLPRPPVAASRRASSPWRRGPSLDPDT
jgi:hypothetical protein